MLGAGRLDSYDVHLPSVLLPREGREDWSCHGLVRWWTHHQDLTLLLVPVRSPGTSRQRYGGGDAKFFVSDSIRHAARATGVGNCLSTWVFVTRKWARTGALLASYRPGQPFQVRHTRWIDKIIATVELRI